MDKNVSHRNDSVYVWNSFGDARINSTQIAKGFADYLELALRSGLVKQASHVLLAWESRNDCLHVSGGIERVP